MILDSQLILSDSQAFTASAFATNVIDNSVSSALGTGEPMALLITVEVAADIVTGDESYTFDLEYSSTANQSSGRELLNRMAYSAAGSANSRLASLLVAGYQFAMPIPPTVASSTERYLGMQVILSGTTPSITISSHVVPLSFIDSTIDYATGYSIT